MYTGDDELRLTSVPPFHRRQGVVPLLIVFTSTGCGFVGCGYPPGNDFQGVFPNQVADFCKTAVEVDLSYNNFLGMVPESLGGCSSLELLDISNNIFSGKFPVDTLLKLSNLLKLIYIFCVYKTMNIESSNQFLVSEKSLNPIDEGDTYNPNSHPSFPNFSFNDPDETSPFIISFNSFDPTIDEDPTDDDLEDDSDLERDTSGQSDVDSDVHQEYIHIRESRRHFNRT
ncbi:hypothetical protein CQW23_31357 [Capsicum baccatum]|uniref:Uncharacterized protein n=1 Tax=Capsicum baccatum TaxID=33114 RepID=A0A2G2V7T0_CAPBA|nr:hypothetical protein CQW23_31357 [Capsicum baccatum]